MVGLIVIVWAIAFLPWWAALIVTIAVLSLE